MHWVRLGKPLTALNFEGNHGSQPFKAVKKLLTFPFRFFLIQAQVFRMRKPTPTTSLVSSVTATLPRPSTSSKPLTRVRNRGQLSNGTSGLLMKTEISNSASPMAAGVTGIGRAPSGAGSSTTRWTSSTSTWASTSRLFTAMNVRTSAARHKV